MNRTAVEIFNKEFLKSRGIQDSTMNYLHGILQAEATIENEEELNEYFFQRPLKVVLRRKTTSILNDCEVLDNKAYVYFKERLAKYSTSTINPQFDAQIKTKEGILLAAYELKSVFGIGTTKTEVFNDLVRLAILNRLFPKTNCVFIIVGSKYELRNFFKTSSFPFNDNLNSKIKSHHRWYKIEKIHLSLASEKYLKVLKDLKIEEIQIRLSRTQSSHRFHCMSYQVRYVVAGQREPSDFYKTTWDCIVSGDIVYEGGFQPPDNIIKCSLIDRIDYDLSKILVVTNDIDDSEWKDFDQDSIVWKFAPKKL